MPKYVLIQARNEADIAKPEEHSSFAKRLGISLESLVQFNIFTEEMNVEHLLEYDGILVGGSGEYSVLDNHPIIKRFNNFVGELSTLGKPMFASCFGFQALALALGGNIIKDPDNAEVGSFDLVTTTSAKQDILFGKLPTNFIAQLGHQDQASILPSCAINMASSEKTPHQAFRIVDTDVFATQFHPELTNEDNRLRFQRYMHIYGKLFGEVKAQEILNSHKPSPESNNLLRDFHKLVVRKMNGHQ
jgi:GMP synthase (glutamine-hydrolysing)